MPEIIIQNPSLSELISGNHPDPFSLLGIHQETEGIVIRALIPEAWDIAVIDSLTNKKIIDLKRVANTALFEGFVKARKIFPYRLRINWGNHTQDIEDAYRFYNILGDIDIWLLKEGTHHRPYEKLGAHPQKIDGIQGCTFAVWAPHAKRVSVVGNFNNWDGRRHMMRHRSECGIWEIFIPHIMPGELYKYEIKTKTDTIFLKSDPFAFRSEMRPDTASIIHSLPEIVPSSEKRKKANALDAPISIYEVHLGSWKKKDGWKWLTYTELAEQLIPYVKNLGFTHIELLPISEHPYDESWGYQPVGLYAITSRFGTPNEFRKFVQTAHENNIGVILDWVPAHFPTDSHGLSQFDGSYLYEYEDPRERIHQDWGSSIYNFGRTEVCNYLVGNALYWIERFGIDGLRVDAVASMLYRDYSRPPGAWIPNKYGGRENLEAIAFLKKMNEIIHIERPEAITIAEESTSFPKVSRPIEDGGLGFNYKWNLGWMNDTLSYMHEDPIFRKHHQDKIRFGLMYAFFENFILPLSHDEVVHCKSSMIGKMPGDEWQRFANLRCYYGFMWGHPGKKLLFMGNEIGQYSEWNANTSIEWNLLQYPLHAGLQRLIQDLNAVYKYYSALHQLDFEQKGFEWIIHGDTNNSVFSFIRWDNKDNFVIVVCNFTPIPRYKYRINVPEPGFYREIINTDAQIYGGSGIHNSELKTQKINSVIHEWFLEITVPPLATCMFIKKESL